MRGGRLLQQRQRLAVARIALQYRAHVPDGLVPLPGPHQQGGEMHAEGHIVRHGLDGLAQTGEHGQVGFHAAVRSCLDGGRLNLKQYGAGEPAGAMRAHITRYLGNPA